jgi:hypothetical protein
MKTDRAALGRLVHRETKAGVGRIGSAAPISRQAKRKQVFQAAGSAAFSMLAAPCAPHLSERQQATLVDADSTALRYGLVIA